MEKGKFIRRYKRFFADVERTNGEILTVHCPNSGSMKGCAIEGTTAWFSDSENPKRKLRHTLEIIEHEGVKICVNTQRPNHLVEEAIRAGTISELVGYEHIRREVKYGEEKSRIDLLLLRGDEECYVEVKNVSLGTSDGLVRFPDAVTSRGTKHLRELMGMIDAGHRAVLVFCISRDDAREFTTADEIDPLYGETLRAAQKHGVEIIAYRLRIDPPELIIADQIPVKLDDIAS